MTTLFRDYSYEARDASIEWLIFGTLLFNWLLAIVNAHVVAISQPHVIVCEILLLGAAVLVIAGRGMRRDQFVLLCAFALYLAFTLLRFAYAQQIAPKPVRDMAIIFVFLALGFSYRREPYRLIYRLSLVIAAVGLVEILFPEFYGQLLNVKAYYINTRGFSESDFWNSESTMFVSGTRPDERFFLSFTNLPRASSVFLEPVSLGNFIVVSLAALLAGWNSLPVRVRVHWIAVLVAILLISDSRYGFACSLVLITLRLVLMRFPQQFTFLIFLAVVAAAWALVNFLQIDQPADNFTGRLFYTFYSLDKLDFPALMGVRVPWMDRFADSGLTYFIVNQSIFGLLFLMAYYSLGVVGQDAPSRFFKNAVMVAFGLSLLISNSMFSIKIAGLMWFLVTAFIASATRRIEMKFAADATN